MIGLLVALLAAAGPPPQKPRIPTAREDVVVTAERVPEPRESVPAAVSVLTREQIKARLDLLNVTDRRWEEVGLALPDFRGNLVPYYFPAAGFTARAGMEWSFQ